MPTDNRAKVDDRKGSYYFPEPMIAEIKGEAARQGRSISWVVQKAWFIARDRIRKIPAPPS